jgi:hypothetical protein
LKKHISVKLLKRRIPLVCKVALLADVVSVRVPGPKAVICIYHHNFTMLPEHGFQLCSVLLFPRPIADESLYSHAIKMKLYSEMVLAIMPCQSKQIASRPNHNYRPSTRRMTHCGEKLKDHSIFSGGWALFLRFLSRCIDLQCFQFIISQTVHGHPRWPDYRRPTYRLD